MNRLESIRQEIARQLPKAQICEGKNAKGEEGLYVDYDGNGSVDYFINAEKTGLAAVETVTGPVQCQLRGVNRFGAPPTTATPTQPPTAAPTPADGPTQPSAPPPAAAPPPSGEAPTTPQAPARTITQTAAGSVRQEATGRIVVSGFTNRGAGIALLNKAYQEAIRQGKPVLLVHGATHCKGCKNLVADAEAAGMTVIYLVDDAEKMGQLFSLPQVFTLPADPKVRFEPGKTPVRETVRDSGDYVAYRARGMQYYNGHEKTGDQQINELRGILARTPVAPGLPKAATPPTRPDTPAGPPTPGTSTPTPAAPTPAPTPPASGPTPSGATSAPWQTATGTMEFENFVQKHRNSRILFVPAGMTDDQIRTWLQSRPRTQDGLPLLVIRTNTAWARDMADGFGMPPTTNEPKSFRTKDYCATAVPEN